MPRATSKAHTPQRKPAKAGLRRPLASRGPKPWDEPGFRFYTEEMKAWLGGYEPVLADEHIGRVSAIARSTACRAGRDASAESGAGWGKGTIPGLTKRLPADIDHNDKIRRQLT